MAFQAHSIPWSTLSSFFRYLPGGPGYSVQQSDIYVQETRKQTEQVEYFADRLEATILEHATIERRKLRPSDEYSRRAGSWKTTVFEPAEKSTPRSTLIDAARGLRDKHEDIDRDPDAIRVKRVQELRRMQAKLGDGWAAGTETRPVFPARFFETYDQYMYHKLNERFRRIETYVDIPRRHEMWASLSSADKHQLDLDRYICADMIKLLLVDAATADDEKARAEITETLLLLAHHPAVTKGMFSNLGMSCCNMSCGFENVGVFALHLFLYLNLIVALKDVEGQSEIVKLVEDPRPKTKAFDWNLSGRGVIEEISPRPLYMNFGSWQDTIYYLVRHHEHQAETIFFQRALFSDNVDQGKFEGERIEKDPLADVSELKRLLTHLWRIIILSEITIRIVDPDYDWFWKILDGLQTMFWRRGTDPVHARKTESGRAGQLMGMDFVEYDLEYVLYRKEERQRSKKKGT